MLMPEKTKAVLLPYSTVITPEGFLTEILPGVLSIFMVKGDECFLVEKYNGIFYLLKLICRCVRVNIVSVQFF